MAGDVFQWGVWRKQAAIDLAGRDRADAKPFVIIEIRVWAVNCDLRIEQIPDQLHAMHRTKTKQ